MGKDGLVPVRLVGRWVELELWLGYLARGAQQQAAQREKRQGQEDGGKNGLLHEATISAIYSSGNTGRTRRPIAHIT